MIFISKLILRKAPKPIRNSFRSFCNLYVFETVQYTVTGKIPFQIDPVACIFACITQYDHLTLFSTLTVSHISFFETKSILSFRPKQNRQFYFYEFTQNRCFYFYHFNQNRCFYFSIIAQNRCFSR